MKLVKPLLIAATVFVAANTAILTVLPANEATAIDEGSVAARELGLCAQSCQEHHRRAYAGVSPSLALLLLPALLIIATAVVLIKKIHTKKDKIAIMALSVFSIALLLLPVFAVVIRYSTWDCSRLDNAYCAEYY